MLIYIFNWAIFIIVIVSLIHKLLISKSKGVKNKTDSFVKQQLVIIITLSLLFGLGWAIGLLATQDIYNNRATRDGFAAIFVLATAFHGFFIFIMHSLRSKDVRNIWKRWFFRVTHREFDELTTSTLNRVKHKTSRDAFKSVLKFSTPFSSSDRAGKSDIFSVSDSNIDSGGTVQHNEKNPEKEFDESTIVVETTFTKSFPDEGIDEKEMVRKKEEKAFQ